MSKSLEVFERKITQVHEFLDVNNTKKALKLLADFLSKAKSPLEESYYNIARSFALHKSNRHAEALSLLDAVIETMLSNKVFDKDLLEHFSSVAQEIQCVDKIVRLYTAIAERAPKDKELALQLFHAHLRVNDFSAMSGLALRLRKDFGLPEFSFHQAAATYLLAKRDPKYAGMISLAKVYLDGIPEADRAKPHVVELYAEILRAQGDFEGAVAYLDANQNLFPLEAERERRAVSLLHAGRRTSRCLTRAFACLRRNYCRGKEFQSIFDVHELAITLLIPYLMQIEPQGLSAAKPFDLGAIAKLFSAEEAGKEVADADEFLADFALPLS